MEHKTGPKEVFLHLLSIVTLYVSVGGFLALLFQYINVLLPDVLEAGFYAREGALSGIRWAFSALIVVFPAYLWTMRVLRRSYAEEPAMREMRVRKWLVYFTLFAAGLLMIGDLVAVVFNFLEGELTMRFVFKAAAMLLVAGMVFFYYLWEMREGKTGRIGEREMFRFFAVPVMLIVAAGMIAGILAAGSPQTKRIVRIDERRVNDLQSIQSYIVEYWRNKERLPERLDDLNDDVRGIRVPADPETGMAYGYEAKGEAQFILCADFRLPNASQDVMSKPYSDAYPRGPFVGYEFAWTHEAGRICFEREIDPDFFNDKLRQ